MKQEKVQESEGEGHKNVEGIMQVMEEFFTNMSSNAYGRLEFGSKVVIG